MVEIQGKTTKETALAPNVKKKRKNQKHHKRNSPTQQHKQQHLTRKKKHKKLSAKPDVILTKQQPGEQGFPPLVVTVEEQTLIAKTGNLDTCEDAIVLGEHFIAVIDGATSKTERRWDGETGGKRGAHLIANAFQTLPAQATARQAVDHLTQAIHHVYEQEDVLPVMESQPAQRMIVCFIALSLYRRELWLVGDCQGLLNTTPVTNEKAIDHLLAHVRALYLETELLQGKTSEELLVQDTGRGYILPLLQRQMLLQNAPERGQYWFAVLDGFCVPDEGIKVVPLPKDTKTIVLASDGYPFLKASLADSEQALQTLLQTDPLLFREYQATKGMTKGNVSFDDRAYVKLRLQATTK